MNARTFLMNSITPTLHRYNLFPMRKSLVVNLLLYGHDALSQVENLGILTGTLRYIKDSERITSH